MPELVLPEATSTNMATDNVTAQSVLNKSYVKFILYLVCVLFPIMGIILGLLVSASPFKCREKMSSNMIKCSCIVAVILIFASVVVLMFAFVLPMIFTDEFRYYNVAAFLK